MVNRQKIFVPNFFFFIENQVSTASLEFALHLPPPSGAASSTTGRWPRAERGRGSGPAVAAAAKDNVDSISSISANVELSFSSEDHGS